MFDNTSTFQREMLVGFDVPREHTTFKTFYTARIS